MTPARPGAVRRFWTTAEDAVLREWYALPVHEPGFLAQLAVLLNRPRMSVALHASRIGLTNWHAKKVPYSRAEHARAKYVSEARFTTKEERSQFQSASMRQWLATHEHPRGATGMTHSDETRKKMSESSRRAWANPNSGLNSAAQQQRRSDQLVARIRAGLMPKGEGVYSRTASGKRADLNNRYFRSSWEANYARFLNFQQSRGAIVSWDYECQVFWFEKIKRGTRSYTPDFKVIYPDGHHEWHEVKGWMDPKSITRIARMRRYYPNEPLRIIDGEWFKDARRKGLPALLPHWETRPL